MMGCSPFRRMELSYTELRGSGVNTQLAWMDRNGRVLGSLGEPGQFERQSISPDGTRVAVGVKFGNARERIWIYGRGARHADSYCEQ